MITQSTNGKRDRGDVGAEEKIRFTSSILAATFRMPLPARN
jgi:hypothetical protein